MIMLRQGMVPVPTARDQVHVPPIECGHRWAQRKAPAHRATLTIPCFVTPVGTVACLEKKSPAGEGGAEWNR